MHRGFKIDVAAVGFDRAIDEARGDRPWLDQRHRDAGARKLHAQRVGKRFDGEFRSGIRAAIGRGDEPEDGGAVHDPSLTPRAHRRDDTSGQIVPAEYIDFELRPQHIGPDVLERAGLSIAAIVKQSGERSCRRRQHMLNRCGDLLRFGIVEIKTLDPDLILEVGYVLGLPRRGEDAPAARSQGLRRAKPDA